VQTGLLFTSCLNNRPATLHEAVTGIPDLRGKNKQFPLPGLLARILVSAEGNPGKRLAWTREEVRRRGVRDHQFEALAGGSAEKGCPGEVLLNSLEALRFLG